MLTLSLVATPSAALSTLASSRWRLKLNFGLEDGSWMPKTVDGWGESGARLLVTTDVAFEDGIVVRPRDASGRSVDGETLVGPPGDTRVLRVLQTSSVVTERGEEAVAFGDGGWCVQRPFGRPADEEGRLGMYLDCTSGCSKRDVAIAAGTRVFFTGAVWDDAKGLRTLAAQLDELRAALKAREAQRADAAEPAGLEALPLVGGAFAARRMFAEAEEMQVLKSKQRFFEQYFPNGVADGAAAHFEPRGTMSLKVTNGAGIMATTSYHVLGTYSAEQLD